jgi:dTMP kinase
MSDRYADATAAYQGAGRGFAAATVEQIINLATGGLKPELTLFFDVSVELALGRSDLRHKDGGLTNRMDTEKAEFYYAVRDAYLAIAAAEPARYRIIDGSGTVETTHSAALEVLSHFLSVA